MGLRVAGLVLVFLTLAPARAEEPASYRIVNVVDDFLAYHDAAKDLDADGRVAAWDRLLESRHREFFDGSIYRGKSGEDRTAFKATLIQTFWKDVAPRIDRLAKRNEGIEDLVSGVVDGFCEKFPDFRADTDFYITVSFSYRGKVMKVGDRDALALGLESFAPGEDLPLRITTAHELFHLHHFRTFSTGGGLYRLLWAEGLATYASAVVVPGHRRSEYLGFPVKKMNRCLELLPLLAADLRKNLGENDHRLKRIYFGAEDNDTRVPPEAGYYVGLLVVESLAKRIPLADLARRPAKEVFPLLGTELDRLAGEDR